MYAPRNYYSTRRVVRIVFANVRERARVECYAFFFFKFPFIIDFTSFRVFETIPYGYQRVTVKRYRMRSSVRSFPMSLVRNPGNRLDKATEKKGGVVHTWKRLPSEIRVSRFPRSRSTTRRVSTRDMSLITRETFLRSTRCHGDTRNDTGRIHCRGTEWGLKYVVPRKHVV